MSFEPDRWLDRRRLKRGVIAWRTLAIVALVALVVVGVGRYGFGVGGRLGVGDYVARLWVDGLIVDDPARDEVLADLITDSRARALIVRIDSPGGTAIGGEALYLALRQVAGKKPVIAVLGTTAASAAYLAALGADRIIARESSITGSIGVILQTADLTELLADIGISTEAIKSAPLKGQPSPFEPLSAAGRAASQAVVDDIYTLFVDRVAERRGLNRDQALALADGRVFTGRVAAKEGLIDGLGGEPEARAWLEKSHSLAASLPIRDLPDPADRPGLLRELLGLIKGGLQQTPLRLDGVVSVWQAQGGK
jgi:protease-4